MAVSERLYRFGLLNLMFAGAAMVVVGFVGVLASFLAPGEPSLRKQCDTIGGVFVQSRNGMEQCLGPAHPCVKYGKCGL